MASNDVQATPAGSTDSSALSSPALSRENSYANDDDGKDGITLPVSKDSSNTITGKAALQPGDNSSSSRHHHHHRVSKQDWLSPPASPHPDTTPFFDESEAKRLHMVSPSLLSFSSRAYHLKAQPC